MSTSWLVSLVFLAGLIPGAVFADVCTQESKPGTANDCAAPGTAGGDGLLFSFRGRGIHLADLDLATRQALYELDLKHFDDRQRLLENMLWKLYLTEEAERQNKSEDQLLGELMEYRVPPEAEIKAFYEANKGRISSPYETIKGQIGRYLSEQQLLAKRDALVTGLKESGEYQLLLSRPTAPVAVIDTSGFPSKGDALAPVEVVEFADYQCPHCRTASEVMRRLEDHYGDKLRVVFMDFPINRSGISRKVAEGGVCAGEQGSYWQYHDAAFGQQPSLSHDSPLKIAQSLGLDEAKFAACLSGDHAMTEVTRGESEARRLGLDSTPTFFVNGVKVSVHDDMETALRQAIDEALAGPSS
ncbi:MAG: DsbA family protein [Gammaproteobacteria bacterium]|nr:DsbA family protein [Gammaproteobacteria bacterium]